jgi:ABC-type transport system involved in cytochrome c biogenesis permease component
VAGLESRFHQGWVTDHIHSGLSIQEYNLLDIKFDSGAMCLFEEFGNAWFEFNCCLFHLHLCKLESIIKLKLQILFFQFRVRQVGVLLACLLKLCEGFLQVLGFLGKLLDIVRYAGTVIVIGNCWFLSA